MKQRRPATYRTCKRAQPERGIARLLSKLGICSRAEAVRWVAAGRATVNGKVIQDPGQHVSPGATLLIDGKPPGKPLKRYLVLNKPRGLVVSAHDEHDRATVFDCFLGTKLPHLSAVGRLDRASEGLLLFTNDTAWAAGLTDPSKHVDKTYHVQISTVANAQLVRQLEAGLQDAGEYLLVKQAEILRVGERHCWLELTLDEGKNRHIRRLLAALEIEVLRLVRVALGPLKLGTLAKGAWRDLTQAEVDTLRRCSGVAV
jgi:23S rRNA pseudouridine2605 synthase